MTVENQARRARESPAYSKSLKRATSFPPATPTANYFALHAFIASGTLTLPCAAHFPIDTSRRSRLYRAINLGAVIFSDAVSWLSWLSEGIEGVIASITRVKPGIGYKLESLVPHFIVGRRPCEEGSKFLEFEAHQLTKRFDLHRS